MSLNQSGTLSSASSSIFENCRTLARHPKYLLPNQNVPLEYFVFLLLLPPFSQQSFLPVATCNLPRTAALHLLVNVYISQMCRQQEHSMRVATTPSLHPRLQWTANTFTTPPFLRPQIHRLLLQCSTPATFIRRFMLQFRIVFVDPLVYERGPCTFPYSCACMFPLACKWWATRRSFLKPP